MIKNILRELFIYFHIDITKNLKYDRLTRKIMKQFLRKDFNCIDVGCHKGEILDLMLKYAPKGKHYAFEPLPHLFQQLVINYKGKAQIFPFALSTEVGQTTFQFVKNAPAYSGLKNRRYDVAKPDIEEISVEINTLDTLIPADQKIDFIKIDVEGGELGVMKGGVNLLKNSQPTIVFECGKGASDYYGTSATDLYSFLSDEIGLNIYTLDAFINGKKYLTSSEFEHYFNSNEEYYFIASKNLLS